MEIYGNLRCPMIKNLHSKSDAIDEIYYQTDVGIIFKNRLRITSQNITWKNHHYKPDAITRIRWGCEKSSFNGLSLGTDYTIALGDNKTESIIFLRSEKKYNSILNTLWKPVCIPLILTIIKQIASGKEVEFGTAIHRVRLANDNLTIIQQNSSQTISTQCAWNKLCIEISNGSLYVRAIEDRQKYARLSYLAAPNIPILEQIIRAVQDRPQLKLLDELLDD